MSKIPDLSFWKLWNISFGFFGVQIAYALQSANISRKRAYEQRFWLEIQTKVYMSGEETDVTMLTSVSRLM